jgi:glutamate synthase (NADPH) small chain
MGKATGFLEFPRRTVPYRDPVDRVKDFKEIYTPADDAKLSLQGSRCMDCGIPFCQSNNGCPISNLIPEWNDLVYKGRWRDAYERLSLTNNFPEFTGRTCPAPCEGACVLGIADPAVTIKNIENAIIDKAFTEGWVSHARQQPLTGKKIAIIGSGPCGLTAADQLNRVGHEVTVFERSDRVGGLLMYGIPNMKLEKDLVDRRVKMMTEAGVKFLCNQDVGSSPESIKQLSLFDAVLLSIGSTRARTLSIPGADANGVHLAMEFLSKNTKSYVDSNHKDNNFISAKDKKVVVIGGGDTGADCIGTSIRHGCKSIVNLELLDMPPTKRSADNPWPLWPKVFRLDYAHEEAESKFGKDPRDFSVVTKEFIKNKSGQVTAIKTARIKWEKGEKGFQMTEIPGSETEIETDLVFLALGFLGPEERLTKGLGIKHLPNGNIDATHGQFLTSVPNIFSAGDCRRGQSLVVWAINEGRGAAKAIDKHLMGVTILEAPLASSI